MIIERVEDDHWLANAYLVAEGPGGHGVMIDGNGVIEPLLARIDTDGITIDRILLTHHHPDHIVDNERYRARFPDAEVCAHPITAQELGPGVVDRELRDGEIVTVGDLEFIPLDTPGHCQGHFVFLLNGQHCFSSDVLFRRTIGGHARPGGNFPELRDSIMRILMALPPQTVVHPGHREATTIGEEWEENLFIRYWRGLDAPLDEMVDVAERGPGTLRVWAPDYDGGHKALIEFADGTEGIAFGSRVTRSE